MKENINDKEAEQSIIDQIEGLKVDADQIFCDDQAAIACEKAFKIKYMFPWQRLVVANIMDAFYAVESQKNEKKGSYGDTSNCQIDFAAQKIQNEENAQDTKSSQNNESPEDIARHQIVLLPTGAGKSLCFQVPALLLPGPTLIIYPLLALMSDQERRMNEGSLKSVVFRGGQSQEERDENFRKIKEENYRIIIANPEVLDNESLLEKLSQCNISHIAIDEAHTVWEWGSSFRKSYLELGKIIKKLDAPVVTAFTATASPEVLENVNQVLFEGDAHIVRSESDRPNIHYYVYKAASKEKAALFLSKTEERPMILFCATRKHAEDMCRYINMAYGDQVSRFYHAGLEKEEKTQVEKWFFDKKDAVLCATCAFGMGVDKSDIRTVVHVDAPLTAESYIQEAGRGGRDRNVANAILLWNSKDEEKVSHFDKNSRFRAVMDFALSSSCRRQKLLDALGGEEAVCSGCDICDSSNPEKAFAPMPGESLVCDFLELLDLVKKGDRFYTEEKLEEAFLKRMKELTLPYLGINIWSHADYVSARDELFKMNKIRLASFPWKNRVELVRKKKTFSLSYSCK